MQQGQAGSITEVPDLHAPIPSPCDQLAATRHQSHGRDLSIAVAGELHESLSRADVPHIHHGIMAATYHLAKSLNYVANYS